MRLETTSEVKKRPKNPRKCVIENYNEDFSEEDDLSSDEHLYCDDCSEEYKGACPTHGQMTLILDREAPKDDPDRAKATLPHFFSLETSSIPNSGIGVWSKIPLPRGIVFGPYEGIVKFEREAAKSGYAWKVETSTDSLYIDAENPSKSNWMRFVNCAPQIEHEQQNLAAFQFRRQVYYKTIKPVLPDTELLVWYGGDYAEDLGISKAQVKEILPKVPKRFPCKLCGALFSESSALKRHRKCYPHRSRRGKFRCEQCFYSTNHSQAFRKHLRTHSDERPYKCEHCNKAFATEAYLKSHTRIHTGERPYACEHCNKAFARKANLERHNRIHTGERRYVCCTCDKAFRQSNHLHVHERTHSEQRPKASSDTCDCWYCVLGRKEVKKKNLHKSIHTQQKQFKCTHCDYKGILRHQIDLHVARIHTKEYKFRCSICNSGFRDNKDLENHCQRVGSTACMATNISEDPSVKNKTDG